MRVNIYAEEMTDKVEVIAKSIDGHEFTGLRFYLELPVTLPDGKQVSGPFTHRPGDDDSSAITFWGKHDLRVVLRKAQLLLDRHYDQYPDPRPVETLNKYAVTVSETKVIVGIPPRHLTKQDAVTFAAWVLVMADCLDGDAPTIEEAMMSIEKT
jgi:hypothetical protein